MPDVHYAIDHATQIARYTNGEPQHGGTCWRVTGPDVDEEKTVAIGVEAFLDKKRRRVILCMVFNPEGTATA